MGKYVLLLMVLLVMNIATDVECKGGRGGGGGYKSSSSGRRGGTSSSSGWSAWGSKTSYKPSAPPAPKPAPKPGPSHGSTGGWINPSQSRPSNTGFGVPPKPSHGSTGGWINPSQAKPASNGYVSVPQAKPASNGYVGVSQAKPVSSGAFVTPTQNKPVGNGGFVSPSQPKVNPPSSNIGPGGYPVQSGFQNSKPPPYPTNTGAHPPQYSAQLPQGHSVYNPTSKVNPPSYSASNAHLSPPSYSAPSYNAPKKMTVNNHYHYHSSPPSYGNSGGASFGYPAGGYYNSNYRPSYGGTSLFSSGHNSYGYPGSGGWGVPSYGGGSSSGGMVKGLLIGAAGGYLANSLIHRVSNPWGYTGSGYGYGYQQGYRDYMRHQTLASATPAPAAAPVATTENPNAWINCVAFDPVTKSTLINPNCTCSVTVVTDPTTGQNVSHHDCTPYATPPPMVPQPPLPVYGVNNPPPSFNGAGLYGSGAAYGAGSYGSPVQGGAVVSEVQTPVNAAPAGTTTVTAPTGGPDVTQVPVVASLTEKQTGHAVTDEDKRKEFYSNLQQLVNMGQFSR